MSIERQNTTFRAALLGALMASLAGCCWWEKPTPTPPLGTLSDPIWTAQQTEGKASDFVVYQHEFELNGTRLNMAGEDHLKSIAARLHGGACLPVVVERSMTSIRPDTEYHFPVHPNPELDMKRREVVVASLIAMGVPNADRMVLVATPIAEGYTATQAARAYNQSLMQTNGYGTGAARGGFGAGSFGAVGSTEAP